jgi:hypothetical protein
MKNAARWFHYTDKLLSTVNKILSSGTLTFQQSRSTEYNHDIESTIHTPTYGSEKPFKDYFVISV